MFQRRPHLPLPGVVRKKPPGLELVRVAQAIKGQEVGHEGCRRELAGEADCAKAQG